MPVENVTAKNAGTEKKGESAATAAPTSAPASTPAAPTPAPATGAKPASSQSASVQPPVSAAPTADETAALKAEIAALREEKAALEAANKGMAEELGSEARNFERSIATTTTKPTWRFRVSVPNHPEMRPLEIVAVDESEAIRLFALKTSPGKPLDTVKCRFKVDCLQAADRAELGRKAKAARLEAKGYAKPTAAIGGTA